MFKRLAACIVWFQEMSIPSTVGIFALDTTHPAPQMLLLYTIMRQNLPPPDLGLPARNFRSPPMKGRYEYFLELGIHHFHRDHNAPYLPPKILYNHCLRFL